MERYANNRTNATCIGLMSIIIWSFLAVLSVNLKNIPAFEICSITSFTGFIAASLTNTYLKFGKIYCTT